ncbi:hypothetical protein Ahy_A07g031573 isoform E [Arachis hypogaea]|uniref:Uncharacterized protein n=1 Tax=Arachis hypogaea TaxID=3818 RepID=A0A445C4G6_ARAHY|nr:hypothetical protein Ahy_A07g031573 isoform E [Arachis hypogaea]
MATQLLEPHNLGSPTLNSAHNGLKRLLLNYVIESPIGVPIYAPTSLSCSPSSSLQTLLATIEHRTLHSCHTRKRTNTPNRKVKILPQKIQGKRLKLLNCVANPPIRFHRKCNLWREEFGPIIIPIS